MAETLISKTDILHVQGNPITIGFPVERINAVLRDGSFEALGSENSIDDGVWVVLRRGLLVRQYHVHAAHNYVFFTDAGHLPCGKYDIEVYYDDDDRQHMRLKYPSILTVVDNTEDGQLYRSDDFDVDAYYPVIKGRASAIVIDGGQVSLFAGRGLNADIGEDSVNLRSGYGESQIEVTNDNVKINIKG